jgi:hypothetical protein
MDLKSYVILFNGELIHMLKSRILLLLTLISSSSIKMVQSIPSSVRGTLDGIKKSKYKTLQKFCTMRYEYYSLKYAQKIHKYINSYNAENNKQPIDPLEDWAVIINYPQGQRNLHKQAHHDTVDHLEEEYEDVLEHVNSKKSKKSRRKAKKQRS